MALQQVDQQIKFILQALQSHNLLKNSVIILLSDHGETLYEPSSRIIDKKNYIGTTPRKFAQYLRKKTATALSRSMGHGNDLLSPNQFHTILGVKLYQNGKLISHPRSISTRVALIDIAPTLYHLLQLPPPIHLDGISLLDSILSTKHKPIKRAFLLESGILIEQTFNKEKIKYLANLFYTIHPVTSKLELKQKELRNYMQERIVGIIDDTWLLAFYPETDINS